MDKETETVFKAVYRAVRLQQRFLIEMDSLIAHYRNSIPTAVPWDKIQVTVGDLYLADAPPRMKKAALYALASSERTRPFG